MLRKASTIPVLAALPRREINIFGILNQYIWNSLSSEVTISLNNYMKEIHVP